ncbi:hypothetical protein Rt10032_c21g6528 [Rhodotorula toruloides]|uniref:Uncharacterized protein n=1 Tax=Rhodotorula toruloides TaxID=5286 RepID=A0A511KQ78_RHOTO|nr:hypothetical protein Rt10032_c21g6528 [Rhodotorula toruloides]
MTVQSFQDAVHTLRPRSCALFLALDLALPLSSLPLDAHPPSRTAYPSLVALDLMSTSTHSSPTWPTEPPPGLPSRSSVSLASHASGPPFDEDKEEVSKQGSDVVPSTAAGQADAWGSLRTNETSESDGDEGERDIGTTGKSGRLRMTKKRIGNGQGVMDGRKKTKEELEREKLRYVRFPAVKLISTDDAVYPVYDLQSGPQPRHRPQSPPPPSLEQAFSARSTPLG